LERELAKFREQAFVQITTVHHTVGLAVPVYGHGKVIAGLSVYVPESRYTTSSQNKMAKLVGKAAGRISEELSRR
jgi:DNA-binding IclR family transcriptional regulator